MNKIDGKYPPSNDLLAHSRHHGGLALKVLNLLNQSDGKLDLIKGILQLIRQNIDIEAVGLRLKEGNDFPYYSTLGFSDQFIAAENSLCYRPSDSSTPKCDADTPCLECVCGMVLMNKTNLELPGFTPHGSFWTNRSSALLEKPPEWFNAITVRGRCPREGFESIALVPLHAQDKTIGLLQLNDHRADRFSQELIEFLEGLGAAIGVALARRQAMEALRRHQEILETKVRQRTADLQQTVDTLQGEVLSRLEAEAALKDANEKLSTERQRLFSVFQHLPGYVCLIGSDYRIRFANQKFTDLFRAGQGCYCYHVLHNQDKPCPVCRMSAILETGKLAEWESTDSAGNNYHVWGYPLPDVDGGRLVMELGLDISERKRLESEVLNISDTERRRIGRDLHDMIGQILAGIAMLAKGAANQLKAKGIPEAGQVEELVMLANQAVSQTRAIARGLCPVGLTAEGLPDTLQEMVVETGRLFGVQCTLIADDNIPVPNGAVAAHLYGIAQEAIKNSVVHGKARHIKVRLARRNNQIILAVRDDGVGDPEQFDRTRGMGLHTMKYRADAIGAHFAIKRAGGGGTIVRCILSATGLEARRNA